MTKTTSSKGAAALLGAAATYASFGLLIREMAKMFGTNTQIAFRFLLAFLLLALYGLITRSFKPLPRAAKLRATLIGVLFSILVLLFTISVTHTTLASSVCLLYAGSIISSLLVGTFALKEKLTTNKIIAIVLALAGLALYSNVLLSLSLGVTTGLLSGVMDGVGNGVRKTLSGYDRRSVMLYQFAVGGIFSVFLIIITGEQAITTFNLLALLAGIVFAFLQIFLNNLLLYGFAHFDVNVGTVILATELFFASLIGWLFYQEIPATREIIGGLIIFSASILSTIDTRSLFSRLRQNLVKQPDVLH